MPEDKNQSPSTDAPVAQAGRVITPDSSAAQPTALNTPNTLQSSPPPEATPQQPPVQPAAPIPQETVSQEEAPVEPPFYTEQPEPTPVSGEESVTWTASEYVEHEKNAGWYTLLALATAVLSALIYLITRDFVSVGVIIFGALALGIYGSRPPRQLEYQLDNQGLRIGQKQFSYHDFRSFAVVPEGALTSIIFVHHKRFAPLTTVYYAPEDEERIMGVLSNQLPLEEHKIDAVEHLMRRIRF